MTTIQHISFEDLKSKYQTPLYIYDEAAIRKQCKVFINKFRHPKVSSNVIYASKAFLTIAMAQLIMSDGLHLDCVSQGELYTALKAGFPVEKIVLHGNNKTKDELLMALNFRVGTIIVDNDYEASILNEIVNDKYKVSVMLRVNPGIDAHTHKYIKTSTLDSKFGMSILDPRTKDTIKSLNDNPNINFLGTHSHIGSQILEEHSFYDHAITILKFYKEIKELYQIDLKAVNLGGGFGVKYIKSDTRLDLNKVLPELLEIVYQTANSLEISVPHVYIEPGRSIVAEAGYTLYTVNQIKETINKKKYLFIDGAMNDHMRTALYQAKYDAFIVGKEDMVHDTTYTVAGKACESGDIIIEDILLPDAKPDDLLVVRTTGAYHYSMASHYNRLTIPPVIFVKDGQSKVVVRKESFMDLLSHDEALV
ncbi:diaminopimelate decarboxylase [Acholeplasma laidlawii]|uniref:diaminopimelate decarboxylase n=1 Tax=Acholeplasma laidlawii TaxID=2148 RepID=UPI000C1A80DD|nr:diaminopimelate decarboxylase [Acholeplasma laidlawii]PII03458.1 diaminopimelate decarboxylase [Acholeplasma laidlawii]